MKPFKLPESALYGVQFATVRAHARTMDGRGRPIGVLCLRAENDGSHENIIVTGAMCHPADTFSLDLGKLLAWKRMHYVNAWTTNRAPELDARTGHWVIQCFMLGTDTLHRAPELASSVYIEILRKAVSWIGQVADFTPVLVGALNHLKPSRPDSFWPKYIAPKMAGKFVPIEGVAALAQGATERMNAAPDEIFYDSLKDRGGPAE